jgi:hypothetical protein
MSDEKDSQNRRRRITDVDWVGWALIVSVAASLAAAGYNAGALQNSVTALEEAMRTHNAHCAQMQAMYQVQMKELNVAIQKLAILAQDSKTRIDVLWNADGESSR